jgi:hypothetical protein
VVEQEDITEIFLELLSDSLGGLLVVAVVDHNTEVAAAQAD